MASNGFWGLLCVAAFATAAAAQPAADEGLVHRRELAVRYLSATHLDDRMQGIIAAITPMMLEQSLKQYPDVPPKVRAAIDSSAMEALHAMLPKLESRFADMMARKFSAAELEQVTAFYESPVGQKIISKSGEMVSEIQPLMAGLLPDMQSDMVRRLCGKIDCTTLPKPAKT